MEHRDARSVPTASELAEALRAPLLASGQSLSTGKADLLVRYLALLLPWNERVNLSGARGACEVVERHLADGFALAAHLPAGGRRFLDVGAGAGFVGVAVAVLRPELHCVLLEPIGKKYTFLRAVARELPLPNLEPRRERLDEHTGSEGFTSYDAAASRATWAPAEWLERARLVLAPGGLAAAFEGRAPGRPPDGAERVSYQFGGHRGTLLLLRV